ncbi:MAG TPA: PAS domain-containing protein [Verrucomicrobiae bacterium]|nr:PAS domain-containing protein [Verrucomicrobiae bacterium]
MLDRKSSSWFCPKPTGDPGRDRNARTLQFTCLLFAFAIGMVALLDALEREPVELPILGMAVAGLLVAAVMNRAGMWTWAARTAILAVLLTAILLVLQARDGFRSHAMLVFPGLLLISVMLLDRASYVTTAGIVLLAVAILGIGEKRHMFRATPPVRTSTNYSSVFFVDLTLLVFALIGSRIARDAQRNVFDLGASEALLLNAQRLAKVGSFELELARGRFTWSEELLRIYGRSEAPIGLAGVLKYIHPKDVEKFSQAFGTARSNGAPVELEHRIVRPDGETRFVRSVFEAIRNDSGGLVRIVGATQDVTDQVQIREHLQESEQRLKSAQRLTHVGSWHWNLGVNHVVCSEECKRIFGRPDDYAPSLEGLLEIIAPPDRARVAGEIQRGIAEKNGCSTEFKIVRPDGDLRTVTFTSQVMLDEEGSPRHIFGACQDVTEDRRAQEEAVASQKLETVGTLANGIAHDFNNLLGGVLTQAELALAELAAGLPPENELNTICSVARSGSEIVRQLMIYTGKERHVPGLADVSRTVDEMAELLKFSISKRAALHTGLSPDLPAVRASGAQIRQIVMNLVMNASEAIGDRDGEIRLTTRRIAVRHERPGWIPQELAAGEYVQLEVADNGRGMSPETQARVYDPFFTTKPLGHGLGLAVVSGIVRGLGGAIQLVSEPEKGTTFHVFLPVAEGRASTESGPDSHAASTGQTRAATALIVEDENTLLTASAKMLRRSGFSVLEAADGTEAVAVIRGDSPIDVLLLDVTLPGTPSRDVLAEARRLRPAMRVIVTSAYGPEVAAASLHTEVERFIRKPYSLHDLVGLIRQTLSSTSSQNRGTA